MPSIGLTVFNGIIPRLHPANLQSGYAEVANDVRLDHGTIRPWRELRSVSGIPEGTKTIYQWGCCWFPFDKCVDIAQWKPSCQRLMVTGWADYPVTTPVYVDAEGACRIGNECCPGWTRLGVCAPSSPPIAVADKEPSYDDKIQDLKVVRYVYTYVNCFCEESAPSYPSEEVKTNEGVPITLTDIEVPPDGWCISKVNIYRLESAHDTGTSKQVQSHETNYFQVGSIDAGETTFVDTVLTRNIGEALRTHETMPPPENLRGITAVYGDTLLAGFCNGNQLYFSRHGECWNWPESEMMVLDDNIISLEAGSNGILHVITDGSPYAIIADAGCDDRKCRQVKRHMEALPGVVCCSGRGSISTPIGTIYVSSYGLVLLAGSNPPVVITQPWFATDDWRKLKPETMRLGYYEGSVFCISDNCGFIFTVDDTAFPKWDTLRLSTISDRPKTMFTNRQGELFMQFETDIRQWNAGNQYRPYTWKSRRIESPVYFSAAAGRIECFGAVEVKLFADGEEVYSGTCMAGECFRLPAYGRHLTHSVEITGVNEVWRVHLATSYSDLRGTMKSA